MNQKKGLGKGLTALIGEQNIIKGSTEKNVLEVDINLIEPNPRQPRKLFDEDTLGELAESIRKFGVIQPLLVKKNNDYYEIIAGERRWRACRMAGIKEIPVIIKEYDSIQSFQVSLIENIQREDLNPIEEAESFKMLIEEFGLNHDQLAEQVGKKRSTISNSLRLLNLDVRVQSLILENKLSNGHGRALLSLPAEMQFSLAEQIISDGLSVRQTEALVKSIAESIAKTTAAEIDEDQFTDNKKFPNKEFLHLEDYLKKLLGTKVKISNKKGKPNGVIAIEFYSDDDLDRLIEIIKKLDI